MTIQSTIKSIQDTMRQDPGVDGDAQRISQLVWMLFLKVYDAKEEEWEIIEDDYKSIIPESLRWRNWAKDEEGITGEDLLEFINEELFKTLKDLTIDETTDKRGIIVKSIFEDSYNYMKNGTLIRVVINKLNEIKLEDYDDRHAFNDIYEKILRDLQNAGTAGEYYTPRPLTDFIIEALDPKIGESVSDLACGTGGFLISALNHLDEQVNTTDDRESMQNAVYGVEKKPLPYLLCITNLMLHDIDEPNILRGNSLADNIRDYTEQDKFDVIAMNPPFGGVEEEGVFTNFPTKFRTSETADLFMTVIMSRLKENGRAGVILPDGFLFGDDNAKMEIKKWLLEEFNLHTIVRFPSGVFSPYTSISTNILLFDKNGTTEKIDYYEVPLPEGYKNGFSKTRPITKKHIEELRDWYSNRDKETIHSYTVELEEIKKRNYNLDIKNKKTQIVEKEYTLDELLLTFDNKLDNMKELFKKLETELDGVEE